MEGQTLLKRGIPSSVSDINRNIENFTANLHTIRSVQAAIVEKWGSGPRERMRERRSGLQGDNGSIRLSVREIFDTGRESKEEIELLEGTKDQWRAAILDAITIDTEHKNKLEEQLVRLLRSLGIRTTREQIETFYTEDIDNIRSTHPTGMKEEYNKDWKQVKDRLDELKNLDAYISTLRDELVKLEEPIFHLTEHSESEADISTIQGMKEYALSFVNDTSVFSKTFNGKRWKLMSCLIAATILGLLVIVIYGIVNAASRSSSTQPEIHVDPTGGNYGDPNNNATSYDDSAVETSTPCVPTSPSDICAYAAPTS